MKIYIAIIVIIHGISLFCRPLILLGASLLRGRDSDGFPQYQEKFIRDCIRKFPYCEATLLQKLVRSIAPVEIVSEKDIRELECSI